MAAVSSAEALLTEHLRYTPLSLIDDIINTINAIIYRALTAIETGLLNTAPNALGFDQPSVPIDAGFPITDSDDPEERQRAEVEEGVHRLETLLESTVDRTFDKFEIYTLRNILWVPDGLEDWVRLKHYEDLQLPLPPSAATPDSITTLRQRLQATQQLNLTLSHTRASNAELINQLKGILTSPSGQLSHLTTSTHSSSSGPITSSARFTKSQLPALRGLLEDLRPRLQTLSTFAASGAKPGRNAELRDERVKYVESVVDRVVSTQLGATREGDKDLGSKRTEEEVQAMERIAAEGVGGKDRAGYEATEMDEDDAMEE